MRAVNYSIPLSSLHNTPNEEAELAKAVLSKFRDGSMVLNTHRSAMEDSFIITVAHSDFDDIDEGFMLPEYDSALHGPDDLEEPVVDDIKEPFKTLKISDDQIENIRDQLATANPVAVGYRLMVKPIPARKGMEASEAAEFSELAKAGFEVKTNNEQSRETHGSDVGIIVNCGPSAYQSGQLAEGEPWAKEGDVVIFPRYCGHICEVPPGSGEKFHFMTDDDLLGKYEGIGL